MSVNGTPGVMLISKSGWDGERFNYLFRPTSPEIAENIHGGVNMTYSHTLQRAGEAKAAGYGIVFEASALPEPWKPVGFFKERKFRKDLKLSVGTD
ncbi:MAG: hypothetical protein JXC85_05230 [Candidatus Aenigmarchaeota archaeon]|nr:hypothetical protein [Candidatus Aenigmarchaeota archaeon]